MNTHLLMVTFRVCFIEIAVSGVNYFLLMNRVYAPRVGELRAHRIGKTARIVYIFSFVLLVRFVRIDSADEYLLAGTSWLLMVLAFEWIGSFIIRRGLRRADRHAAPGARSPPRRSVGGASMTWVAMTRSFSAAASTTRAGSRVRRSSCEATPPCWPPGEFGCSASGRSATRIVGSAG